MAENETTKPRAVRLTIAYQGDQLELVAQQSVETKTPPSDPAGDSAEPAGFWVDLKDDDDRTLYRRTIHDPIPRDVESSRRPAKSRRSTARRWTSRKGSSRSSSPSSRRRRRFLVSSLGPPPPRDPGEPDIEAEGVAPARVREIARFDLRARR